MIRNLTQSNSLSAQRRNSPLRGGNLILALALAIGAFGPSAPALAAPPVDQVAYVVNAVPTSITLCPGETTTLKVSITRAITHDGVGGRPRALRTAQIRPQVVDSTIGNITPNSTQTASFGRPSREGSISYSWTNSVAFNFKAEKIGSTTITFTGVGLSNSLTDSITVNVSCKFKVDLYASWTVPAKGRTFYPKVDVLDAMLIPDANGQFFTVKSSRNKITAAMGACPGVAQIGGSDATFDGTLHPDGKLHVAITFTPVANGANESCRGKAVSGTAQPHPLKFDLQTPGRTHWFFSLGQGGTTDAGTYYSSTLIYVYKITP